MKYFFVIPCLLLLCSMIGGLPYAFFQLLRIVITAFAGWVAYKEYTENTLPLTVVFGAIALLFNPIIPFHMSRSTWLFFDVATGVVIAGYGIWKLKGNKLP